MTSWTLLVKGITVCFGTFLIRQVALPSLISIVPKSRPVFPDTALILLIGIAACLRQFYTILSETLSGRGDYDCWRYNDRNGPDSGPAEDRPRRSGNGCLALSVMSCLRLAAGLCVVSMVWQNPLYQGVDFGECAVALEPFANAP